MYTIADAKRKRLNYFLIAKEIDCVLLHQGSGKTNKGKAAEEMCSAAFLSSHDMNTMMGADSCILFLFVIECNRKRVSLWKLRTIISL